MSVLESIISLYAPHSCLGCGFEGSVLCRDCLQSLPPTGACCYQCHADSRLGRTCAICRQQSQLVSANCAVAYDGLAKDVLWALKFDRAQAAADCIGKLLAELYADVTPEDALIVPLPTAMKRVRKRGYDQSALIALAYSRATGCRYAPLLERFGSQEQKGAGRQQRHQQLSAAFAMKRSGSAAGRRIILIDDVVTTGASFEAAATVLKADGAKVVAGLAFARA